MVFASWCWFRRRRRLLNNKISSFDNCYFFITLLLFASINCLPTLSLPANTVISKRAFKPQQISLNFTNNPQNSDSIISPQPLSSCDLLLSANENINSYCQCKDVDQDIGISDQELASSGNNSNSSDNNSNIMWRINQLNCYPQNLTQIVGDIFHLLTHNNSSLPRIQVDYFGINTNLTDVDYSTRKQLNLSHEKLLIDHISLQLTSTIVVNHNDGDIQRKTIDFEEARSRFVEEQMIDFVHLINETHLQFLSIFLEDSIGSRIEPQQLLNSGTGNGTGRRFNDCKSEIKFARLLAMLTGLSRLELSLGGSQKKVGCLLLESETLKEQAKLRWLNLASNGQIKFDRNIVKKSPFTYTPNLEYLNLESSNLASFPLFSLFTVPLISLATTNNLQPSSKLYYYGLPNLTSLNLAGNKLASFEEDLFTQISDNNNNELRTITAACYNTKHDNNNNNSNPLKVFHMPSLTQLDLSYNRLRDMTFKTGQFILCSMPNLNQLYLQHNKIIHLNLNSLLTYPIDMPNSFQAAIEETTPQLHNDHLVLPSKYSQLEHIDLSHNQLNKITAIQWIGNTTSETRVKSINLNYNKLQHPVTLLNSNLMNKLIFEEAFVSNNESEILSLNNLESFVALNSDDVGAISSLCDFLSSSNNKISIGGDLLNEILLTNNELLFIDSNYFLSKQCGDVQILRLSKNRIEFLTTNSLFELRSLEQLDLSYNSISHLKEETFSKNIRLRILDLSYNRLNSIKKNLFSYLTELESLSLSNNQLIEMPNESFAHNNQLEIIDLSNNKLTHLDDLLFYNTKYLRLLNLRGNQLRKFSHLAFEQSDSSSFYKVDNAIPMSSHKPIAAGKRIGHLKMQKLSKRRHNRQAIEGDNVLVLTANQVDSIQFEKCVQFGHNIQLLWLNENRLKELLDTTFRCFRSIQKLYLNSNRIRMIGEFTFHHLIQLEYLDLSNNLLNHVQADSLAFPNSLSHIDLSSNQLVNVKLFETFAPKGLNTSREVTQIERINLSDNPDLTIESSDLIRLMNQSDSLQVELGNIERIISATKDNIVVSKRERNQIQILNLSSINYIDESLFTILSESSIAIERLDLNSIGISPKSNHKFTKFLGNKIQNGLTDLNLGGNRYNTDDFMRLFSMIQEPVQLQFLNITNNLIENWPFSAKIAQKINKLKSLDLSNNKLRQFIKDESNNYAFPELEILNLSSNSLISLADHPKHRMMGLKNLMPEIKQLDLSHNRLSWIPLQFLDDLNQLNWLRLDNNQLESLSPVYTNQRLMLDLSFNHKLRTLGGGVQLGSQNNVIDQDDLIIFEDPDSWTPQIKCHTIDDYLEEHADRGQAFSDEGVTFLDWNSLKDDERVNNDKCASLIQTLDSIRSDAVNTLFDLNSIKIEANKFLHLSLRRNGITKIETSYKNKDIVLLNLSENKIQDLPATLCKNIINLRSLDLSYNQISKISLDASLPCTELNYLDLGHNKISSWTENSILNSETSALQVLKLNNNQLKDLSHFDERAFKLLRFLDIRFNQLKSSSYILKLQHLHLLTTLPYVQQPRNYSSKLHLKLSNTSLAIEGIKTTGFEIQWDTISVHTLGSSGVRNNSIVYHPESSKHTINFCTLNLSRNFVKVCLGTQAYLNEEELCFHLITPKNIQSCLTNLREPESADTIVQNSTVTNSSLLRSTNEQSSLKTEVDPVLNFIDFLKKNWLKLKEMDLNDYLTSLVDVKGDSTWTTPDGKFAIHTSTIVKLIIVGGSICIVILLVAIFTLITCRPDNKLLSPKSNSELTNIPNTDSDITDSSITNNIESHNSTLHIHRSSSPSIPCSSNQSKSTSDNDTLKNTVMERKIMHQLDPNQLMQQQQQQACSTPSSSLAPSSVETAETLQAVDSIKSGTPIQLFGGPVKCSVDQYTDNIDNTNIPNPQYQVATVMRMVKSSSANFNSASRNPSERYDQTYGTLNNRHVNYPTLKSKLRSIYENQHPKHQIYPVNPINSQPIEVNQYDLENQNMYSYISNSYVPEMNNTLQPDQDPTTMSLLSINSALSNNYTNVPTVNQLLIQNPDVLSNLNDQAPTLCQYHRQIHKSIDGSGIILEQQEEEQHNSNDLNMMNNLPPPPSSRVIEALENSIHYMQNTPNVSHFPHN